MKDDEIREYVRERYAQIATQKGIRHMNECSCNSTPHDAGMENCCEVKDTGSTTSEGVQPSDCCCSAEGWETMLGYSAEELMSVPEETRMGLGCGNPTALASLGEGEIVLDLGAGGGIDCFLAATAVGKGGKVVGVDMTPEMVSLARENARKGGYDNVEFRLGEIENLPVADNSVDVIISNCVINLSPDKPRVFAEALRVLKPGGRLMVSDIVLTGELPEVIRDSLEAYAACIAGASMKEDYLAGITKAGFNRVDVVSEQSYGQGELDGKVISVSVCAVKPN